MFPPVSGTSRLLDPSSTAAVILGAHDWSEAGLGRAPSFLRSARHIVSYLYNSNGLGLDPEFILDLFDDTAAAGDQLSRVRDTLDTQLRERRQLGRPITDVLIYYIGHGSTDDEGHLSLLVRRSRKGLEAETGIKAPDLARTLRLAAPHQRRSVILDCCFSEAAARAFLGMAGDMNQQVAAVAAKDFRDDAPARGTLLLCSSPVGEISVGHPNAQRTLFTGAVLDVLTRGQEQGPALFSFADLRDAAFDRMVIEFGANAPRPVLHQVNAAKGDLTRFPAFPNVMPLKSVMSQPTPPGAVQESRESAVPTPAPSPPVSNLADQYVAIESARSLDSPQLDVTDHIYNDKEKSRSNIHQEDSANTLKSEHVNPTLLIVTILGGTILLVVVVVLLVSYFSPAVGMRPERQPTALPEDSLTPSPSIPDDLMQFVPNRHTSPPSHRPG